MRHSENRREGLERDFDSPWALVPGGHTLRGQVSVNIVARYLLTLLGNFLLLVVALWWVQAQEWLDGGSAPPTSGSW